ncbi:MAG: type II toxin-antitoxin system VapC family toxin, partial [Burkholderiaceae bacterium]
AQGRHDRADERGDRAPWCIGAMTGLDTNVIVRYIMQDDPRQSPLATRHIESLTAEAPGYVTIVAVVELAWVLTSAYELGRAQLVEAIEGLLRTKEIVVERAETLWKALRVYQDGTADLADCLIERCAAAAGADRTMTLDRAAARDVGMTLLK